MLVYLADNPKWLELVREEVEAVATRYCADPSVPTVDRLMQVPIEAWDAEFPTIDLMLKECIRMNVPLACLRKNLSSVAIPLNKEGTEVIPPEAYVSCHMNEVHQDPDIYTDPLKFDPARYLPGREEDKKKPYAWVGWGAGRHPCLGMKFAKLENTIITAFWIASFQSVALVDADGSKTTPPPVNLNADASHKPARQVFIDYTLRKQ